MFTQLLVKHESIGTKDNTGETSERQLAGAKTAYRCGRKDKARAKYQAPKPDSGVFG